MINNYEIIKPLLDFPDKDTFYLLSILQRKKENPELGSNSRVIKNYYINSIEYLEKRMPEIISLCDMFNARAMLRLNKRSYRKTAFKAMINMSNSMGNQEFKFVQKSYDRAVGQGHNDKVKKWILDIDKPYGEEWLLMVKETINNIEPLGNKILKELPTKNGVHLITTPFNLKDFKQEFTEIEVHKDNPVNLYIPMDNYTIDVNRIPEGFDIRNKEDLFLLKERNPEIFTKLK